MKSADSILGALTEPVLLLDSTLRAVRANPALYDLLKLTRGTLEGTLAGDLLPGDDGQSLLMDELGTVAAHGKSMDDFEVICILPSSKKQMALSLNARRMALGDDNTSMILVELRDVTIERDAEQGSQDLNAALMKQGHDLQGINEELESFSHSVSHDLRTPLRLTNKIGHLLLEEHASQLSSGAIQKIQMMLDSTAEMGKLIDDLLTFSKVNRLPIKRRTIDMQRLAREAINELRDEFPDRIVTFEIDELPSFRADRALLKQVFLNLLANALKFTQPRERSEIHLGFLQRDGETIYFVRDNGVGFDMDHVKSLFIAFNRLHRDSFEGSGIGLALVRRIVERHKGRIWAEGERDKGATFYFTLGENVSEGMLIP